MAPFEPEWAKAIYHLYVIRVEDRESLMAYLAKERIGTGIHYPVPLHLQKAYEGPGHRAGDFPVSERVGREIVSLPMFPQLTAEQQKRVVHAIAECQFPAASAAAKAGSAVRKPDFARI